MVTGKVHPLLQQVMNEERKEEGEETEMRRRFERYSEFDLSLPHRPVQQGHVHEEKLEDGLASVPEERRALYYFEWLDKKQNLDIDHSLLKSLLQEADINAQDESGYAILHYVSSQWDVSIATEILNCEADVNIADTMGRTPAHIAAYSNHVELLKLLLEHGADIMYKTKEQQSLVHYAVRSSAVDVLNSLLDKGAVYDGKESRDYLGRTPLQLAAELDRSEVVEYLLSHDSSPARCDVIDDVGHPALASMAHLMPSMAALALDQLHKIYPSKRRQEYLLNHLESQRFNTQTPFQAAVEVEAYSILTHPVMRKLIQEKWRKLARWYYFLYLGLYLLFLSVWTIVIVYPPIQEKHSFDFPTDIWRVILEACQLELMALILLFREVSDEVVEQIDSYKQTKRFKQCLCEKLLADIKNCGSISSEGSDRILISLFQDEKQFMQQSCEYIKKLRIKYFDNAWNLLDIAAFGFLLLTSVLHIIDIAAHTESLALWTARIACIAIVLIWARLLKFCRASEFLGPLISIIGQISVDVLQYFLIFLIFYLPFLANFWLMFGGDQQNQANITNPSEELTSIHRVAVVLFRMTVVDEYPYQVIRDIDELTGTLLVISFLIITAIIGLNLFIALLSDTFQRIYDNAQANAELQKAQLILSLDAKTTSKHYRWFLKYIADQCSPASDPYDDDGDGASGKELAKSSVQKITHQTNALVNELLEKFEVQSTNSTALTEGLQSLSDKVDSISAQLREIKAKLGATSVTSTTTLPSLATSWSHGAQPMDSFPLSSVPTASHGITAKTMPTSLKPCFQQTVQSLIHQPGQRHRKKLIVESAGEHVYLGHRRLKQTEKPLSQDQGTSLNNNNNNNSSIYI